MLTDFSARILVLIALGVLRSLVFGLESQPVKRDGDGRGLLGGLLGGGGGGNHYGFPGPQYPFPNGGFGGDLTNQNGDVSYKVYTVKSAHSPLVASSADALKKAEAKKYTPGAAVKMIISDWMYEDGTQLVPAQNIKNAYITKKGPENIIIVDWSSMGNMFLTDKAVDTVKKVGKKVTEFIETLIKEELLKSLEDLSIIGLGGGAQVAAVISHRLKKNDENSTIGRITGLDPTGPGFKEASASNKLDPSDAKFVEVWHCNAAADGQNPWNWAAMGKERFMGIKEHSGSVDFYINGGSHQPGCDGFMGHIESCSHTRCFDIFVLTVKGMKLTACECEDWSTFLSGSCDCEDGPLIGDATPEETTGTYYIKTAVTLLTKVPKSGKSMPGKSEEEEGSEEEHGNGNKMAD